MLDSARDAEGRPHVLVGRGIYGKDGELIHHWLGEDGWQQSVVTSGIGLDDAQIEFYDHGATIAWSQWTEPAGVWVTDGEATAMP